MEGAGIINGNINGQQQQGRGFGPSPASSAVSAGSSDQQRQSFRNDVPVFLDQTFTMIENVPDHIVSWSAGGDTFIVKQVHEFEEILPSYYNHNKYLSFVRQLNFYGFKKVKERETTVSTAVDSLGGEAVTEDQDSWQEFSHPRFRRGRRDLLGDIKRQKDAGRQKRKQAELHKSDMLSDLVTKVDDMNDELKAVNGKLGDVVSLLSHPNVAMQLQNMSTRGDGSGDGGVAIEAVRSIKADVAASGSVDHGGQSPYNHAAPLGYYASHRHAVDHHQQQRLQLYQRQNQQHYHQQGWPGQHLHPQQFEQSPSKTQNPDMSYQARRHDGQTSPPAAPRSAEAHATAPHHHQILPSLRHAVDENSGGAPPPAFAFSDLHRMQHHQHQPQGAWAGRLPPPSAAHFPVGPGDRHQDGGGGSASDTKGQAQQDLSRIEALSVSAARGTETENARRMSKSANSSSDSKTTFASW